MSKLGDLPRVKQPEPKPVEWKMCRACKAYKAECYAPIGDGSAQMCWLCAHAVVDHDCPLHEAATHECECLPHEIYPDRLATAVEVDRLERGALHSEIFEHSVPADVNNFPIGCEIVYDNELVLDARHIRFEHGDTNPRKTGVHSLSGHFYNPKTGAIETVVDDKVIAILGVPVESAPVESAPVVPVGKVRVRRKPA